MTAERRCFRTPRTCFGGVAAHDTLKSGLSVSAAGRPVSVVPRRPGRGPPTEPTARPARSGQPKPPGAGELAPLRPRPARGARAAAASPNSYFCLLFVSLWGPAAGGTRAGVPGPGRDSAPRTRAGGGEPAPELGGAGLRGRTSPSAGRVEPASSQLGARSLSRVKVSVPGRAHAAQGGERRRPRGRAGWGAPGGVGLWAASPSSNPGRTRLPQPPPPPAASRHRATRAAPRAGRGQLFPSDSADSTRSVGLSRPPPLLPMPSLFIPLLSAPPLGKILLLHGSKSGPF